jgi:hypothetical protein
MCDARKIRARSYFASGSMSAYVNKCLNLCRISGPQAYHMLKRLKMQGFIEGKFRETVDEHK